MPIQFYELQENLQSAKEAIGYDKRIEAIYQSKERNRKNERLIAVLIAALVLLFLIFVLPILMNSSSVSKNKGVKTEDNNIKILDGRKSH